MEYKNIIMFLIISCVTACRLDNPKDDTIANLKNNIDKSEISEKILSEVRFDWDKDGKLDNIKLMRGERDGPGFDDYLKLNLTKSNSSKIIKSLTIWNGSYDDYSDFLKLTKDGEVIISFGVSNSVALNYEGEFVLRYNENNFIIDKFNRNITTFDESNKHIERICNYDGLDVYLVTKTDEGAPVKKVSNKLKNGPLFIDRWDDAFCTDTKIAK